MHYDATLKDFVFVNEYGTKTIKFADSKAVKSLNRALLKFHYGIDWDIPEKNLCPPIPGRLDYLLHVQDLVQRTEVKLLDIGTGANLIYPILGKCHFNWQCTGSEVDIESLENAQKIILQNPKLENIELRHQQNKNLILQNIILDNDVFDVVICNPPFFKSTFDAHQKNQRKVNNLKLREKDNLNFSGVSNELWYKGGEDAFIRKMAMESLQFKNQVQWFTSLVSQKDNLFSIKKTIEKLNPSEIRVINMDQGNKKSRFIAWTFR